ncbi:probable ribosomal protein S11, mitochondrial [Salvia hispanica]|uniref:probable ribosomal protein S11, mitochondrial n=1 Tax=Salvia hispanica TaxID=49212 RepID=UPI002009623D|nr:probable ribosomal protein S11, mitochondrial [Salvia hispanica]
MGWKAAQKLIYQWKTPRGSNAMVFRGNDKGETVVERVIRSQNRVIVDGKNLKHIKQGQGHDGGIFTVEAPLRVSNVQAVNPVTGKPCKVGSIIPCPEISKMRKAPRPTAGLPRSLKIETHLPMSILGNLGMKLGLVRAAGNVHLPCALSFRSFLHSGEKPEVEAGRNHRQATEESGNGVGERPPPEVGVGRNLRSNGYDQLLNRERGNGVNGLPPQEVGGWNLGSIGYDQLLNRERGGVNGLPPHEVGVGRNLGSVGYAQLLNRERGNGVNGPPPLENESGRTPLPNMDYVRGLLQDERPGAGRMQRLDDVQGRGPIGGPAFYQQSQRESNADIVHIKLMRNNSYVTLTDYKGNRKMSVSAGQVAAKGDKPGRYSGEAAAEYMGRVVKQMKIKSVVVKVSGFTFFRRKKDSILAFKDGYTHSRGDVNPVVYIEDTTRKPHNGCRLPKKRRI